MENKEFIYLEDFSNIDVDSDDDVIDSIHSNFYYILQKCDKNKGCKDFLPLIPEVDKYNIKIPSVSIAIMYLAGVMDVNYERRGLETDEKKAIYWGKKVFDNFGIIEVGEMLASVYVKNKQYKDAYNVYQTLSEINHHIALTALGNFYKNGLHVEKDLDKASDYYQKATKYGNLSAPMRIAGVYRQQGKYLKSLLLLIASIGKRIKETLTNKNAEEKFREM